MGRGGKTVDRLREFLRGLTIESRSQLIAELERRMLRGEHDAASDLILNELRRLSREGREKVPRYGSATRVFFEPLTPFIVDDVATRRHPGRITRSTLDQLWSFVQRDLAADEVARTCEGVSGALAAGDNVKAQLAVASLHEAVASGLEEALDADDRERRRILAQIGTPRADEDLVNLMRILRMRDRIAFLADHLPSYIANLSDTRLSETRSLIASAVALNPDISVYAVILVMERLNEFWQVIRLGMSGPRGTIDNSYGSPVSVVLAELSRMIDELRTLMHSDGVGLASMLQTIHNALRGLRTELDPPADSAFARELAALRKQISELLRGELESVPARVRRLLRPRPASEIKSRSVLDATEVADTEAAIALVAGCRNFAGEFAVNEVTQRSYSDVQNYLDQGVDTLLDALRQADDNERSFRQSQADAAIRFCGKLFGPDYAAMLTKATEVAAAAERKPQQIGA
jgi:hypothetical protein